MSLASNGGGVGGPAGNLAPDGGDPGRSEDGIGTGPIVADYDSGTGYGVGLPSSQVGALLSTVSGTGIISIQAQGNGNSVVSFSGNMSFRLSAKQLSSKRYSVLQPSGKTKGRIISRGKQLIFIQVAR